MLLFSVFLFFKYKERFLTLITVLEASTGSQVVFFCFVFLIIFCQEEARRHFKCPILEGMELENQGGMGTELNHWEKRLLEVFFFFI